MEHVTIYQHSVLLMIDNDYCIVYSSLMQSVATGDKGKKVQRNATMAHKTALMSQAPMLPFDTDLYEWENPNSIPNEIQ